MDRTGRIIYGVRSDVKKGTAAAELCAAFKVTKSAFFEQSVHGEVHESFLSKLWVHRMTFLRTIWEEAGKPERGFPGDQLSKYALPPDFERQLQELKGKTLACAKAIMSIMRLTCGQ